MLKCKAVLFELTNGKRSTIERQRRHDDIHTRAVWQARVAYRARFVDAPANLANYALTNVQELLVVGKTHVRFLNLAVDLDVGRARAIDHDVGNIVARQKRLQRAVTQNVVADILEQFLLLRDRHNNVLDLDDLADDIADFRARRRIIELCKLR